MGENPELKLRKIRVERHPGVSLCCATFVIFYFYNARRLYGSPSIKLTSNWSKYNSNQRGEPYNLSFFSNFLLPFYILFFTYKKEI